MNKDYLTDIYKDFFETPLVENPTTETSDNHTFDISCVEDVLLTEQSLEILLKILQYMKKYHDKEVERYLDFHVCLESNNKETIQSVEEILLKASSFYQYVSSGKSVLSFYEVDSLASLKEIFFKNFIIIRDIKALEGKDESFKQLFFHVLEENLNHKMILLEGTKKEISYFFEFHNTLQEMAFPFSLVGREKNIQEVYREVLSLTHKSEEDEFSISILDYISETYGKKNVDYPSYRDSLCREILFSGNVPKLETEKSMDEIFESLNGLVGLEKVKNTLHELVDYMSLKDKNKDLKLNALNLHMVFLGNPGTGKTTVARIIVDILYHLKYIKQNKLIEVTSKDLVAEYVGQTAPKTMGVVERARGGVLFIDEAYALASRNNQNSYNAEAIATLIKAMEDFRDDLVVIFAGYTKEMQDFLDSNSGIVSRIGYTLEFDDYTEDELVAIFDGMMKKAGFIVEEEAYQELRRIIEENIHTKNFGNARFIRNVYEKTIVKHASNTKNKKQKKILSTITKNDISCENLKSIL